MIARLWVIVLCVLALVACLPGDPPIAAYTSTPPPTATEPPTATAEPEPVLPTPTRQAGLVALDIQREPHPEAMTAFRVEVWAHDGEPLVGALVSIWPMPPGLSADPIYTLPILESGLATAIQIDPGRYLLVAVSDATPTPALSSSPTLFKVNQGEIVTVVFVQVAPSQGGP